MFLLYTQYSEQNNKPKVSNMCEVQIFWKQHSQIETGCLKKLRADYILGMPATLGPESFLFPFSVYEHKD
jgi:hypothetical protein